LALVVKFAEGLVNPPTFRSSDPVGRVTVHCPQVPVPPAALAGALGSPATKAAASKEVKVLINAPNRSFSEIKRNFVLVAIFRVYPKKMREILQCFGIFGPFSLIVHEFVNFLHNPLAKVKYTRVI
jgi:predicted aminopeptidase